MTTKVKDTTEDTVKSAPEQVAEKLPELEKADRPQRTGNTAAHAPTSFRSVTGRRGGATAQASKMTAMQRTVGNARLSRMLGSAPEQEALTQERQAQRNGVPQMLSVSQPDSPSEREAEAVAQRVVAGHKAQPITPVEKEHAPLAQREATGTATESMDTSAATNAVAHKGAGSPVNADLRRSLEPRMGADLGAARVHSDSDANDAASSINARAFTHGSDIFLARGESEHDPKLMAHELTHVVQQTGAGTASPTLNRVPQGTPAVGTKGSESKTTPAKGSKSTKAGEEELVATAELELKGKTEFPAEEPVGKFLEEHTGQEVVVNTRFGSLAKGQLRIKRDKKGKFHAGQQPLPLSRPLLAGGGEALQKLEPSLIVSIEGSTIKGYIGPAAMSKLPKENELSKQLDKAPELFGLVGFDFPKPFKLTNNIDGGILHLGLEGVTLSLGSAFTVTLEKFMVEDEKVTFVASAEIIVKGLAKGTLKLERTEDGLVTGKVNIAIEQLKNFSGSIEVVWDGRAITGTGEVGYQGEKLSGKVILNMMERKEAEALAREKKPPEEAGKGGKGGKGGTAETGDKPKKGQINYVVFGEGDLTFAFTDWLNGMAHVIVDQDGYVTIIGKITPQKQFELFELKEFVKPLFKFEARAAYGLPVVGNIFIFANVGLDAVAKLGPAILKDITVEGKYSTDPKENKDFRVSGVINVSAFAGLRLRAEAGVGIEILSHDIKAGAGINGVVGIQGYAEAKPVIGYREKGEPGEDKKGEFFISGDLEIAAQPFLGLSGDLFVELDTPWWSPLSDDKWTWPLGSKEWPIGGSFGLKASVDYVFGSKQWPSFEFQPVDFDSEKFMTDMYNDKAKPKSADAGEQKGDWKEKNQAAEAPKEGGGKIDGVPGNAGELTPANATVEQGGGKKTKKDVDPNAKTADGKAVKELQEEAMKEGKKPEGEDLKGAEKAETDKDKTGHAEDKAEDDPAKRLEDGLAELDEKLDAATTGDGLSPNESKSIIQAVKTKYKFKVLEIRESDEGAVVHGEINPGRDKKKDLRSLRVKASVTDARLIQNPAVLFHRDVAMVIDAAQEVMNDLYREEGEYGDLSSAFMAMKEQFEGGLGQPPKALKGKTLHAEKCRQYIKGLQRHRPDLPPEAQDRVDAEIEKMTDALKWADDYRDGQDTPIPKWAKPWRGELGH